MCKYYLQFIYITVGLSRPQGYSLKINVLVKLSDYNDGFHSPHFYLRQLLGLRFARLNPDHSIKIRIFLYFHKTFLYLFIYLTISQSFPPDRRAT